MKTFKTSVGGAGRGWRRAMLCAAGLGVVFASSPALAASDCFAPLRAALERGGYGGWMSCDDADIVINAVGQTRPEQGPAYKVYQLSYRTKVRGWGVAHGGDRILIFDAQDQYLGYYQLMYGQHLRIEGTQVVFDLDPKWGDRFRLEGPQPPQTVWLDGEVERLTR